MAVTFTEGLGRVVRSPGFKFFLICGLILILSIPLAIVWFLVEERQSRATSVEHEIGNLWGADQTITGPFLVVPYTVKVVTTVDDKKSEKVIENIAVFLPDTFNVKGSTASEIRRRSIYEVTVYTAKLKLSGHFVAPDIRLADPNADTVRWRDARIVLGLTDVSGLKETVNLVLNGGQTIPFEPSTGLPNANMQGMNARLFPTTTATDVAPKPFDFEADLVLAGSQMLRVAPVGRETRVDLQSDWPHPSFAGAFLPETRDLRADGFNATWRVPHLARSVPQVWSLTSANETYSLNPFTSYVFGVNYFLPVDYFNLVTRAAKYGLMFLTVAFLAVFTLELTSQKRVHPVQYVFVGLAMILFYVLLLSLSEHIGFTVAYFAASGATGGMLSLYVGKALANQVRGLIMLGIFLILYVLLYLILRLEDYALLAGAIAGFAMLTVTMFATLRINWSGGEAATSSK